MNKNRIALVIGNSDYLNVDKLNNPKNDANDIESVLRKLDFDVTKVMDAKLIDIQQAVNTFLQELDEYAVGLFFYAGHGMQLTAKIILFLLISDHVIKVKLLYLAIV